MRMHRLVIAVLAFCLVGPVPFTASSSAAAAVEPAARQAGASVEAPRPAKPARNVAFKFKELRRGYKFVGKVQHGERAKVNLMRSSSKKGRYGVFKTARSSGTGNFAWTGLSKPGWYYVKVPGNKTYATSYSQLIHVYYV
jgi:hypothetical protein